MAGFWLLTVSCVLVAAEATSIPCWVDNPSLEGQGQIGIANGFSASHQSSETLSQLRAIGQLCRSVGRVCKQSELKAAADSGLLAGEPLYLKTYMASDKVYAYAGFSPPSVKSCPKQACNLEQCSPEWLCAPGHRSEIGLIGVSYRATSFHRQMETAIENALLQADFLYGVEILAQQQQQEAAGTDWTYSKWFEFGEVETGKRSSLSYSMLNQCSIKDTLFTHVVLHHPLKNIVLPVDSSQRPPAWIMQPKTGEVDGAVGIADQMHASGLLSAQIKLAIKRALISLAFEESSHVSDEAVTIAYNGGGLLRVSHLVTNTAVELKAQVLTIYFSPDDSGALKVYAWVARHK